jgi:hypothetical protein
LLSTGSQVKVTVPTGKATGTGTVTVLFRVLNIHWQLITVAELPPTLKTLAQSYIVDLLGPFCSIYCSLTI